MWSGGAGPSPTGSPAWRDQHLGAHPHRVRAVHPPGQRLLAGAPAARAAAGGPVPRRLGGHPRRWCWRRRSGWCPRSPGGCSSCSATRRWPRPPTPCPSCCRWPVVGWSPAKDSTPGSPTWCAAGGRRARAPARRRVAVRRGRGGGCRGPRPSRWWPRREPSAHRIGRRPRRAGRAVADPRGRRRAGGAQPEDPGVLRLGGRRGPARSGWAPGCATSTSCCASTGWTGCPTGTSATAACTCGSTSRSRPATPAWPRRSSATSSPRAPSSCASTAARCRASTATGGPARSCCR